MTVIGRRFTHILAIAIALMTTADLAAQRDPGTPDPVPSAAVMALACSATLVSQAPAPSILVTGGQDSFRRMSYGPGDLITINAGTDNGIEVGQLYYVRRLQAGRFAPSRTSPAPLRTTGWVRVYAVDKTMSLVTVSHACDTIDVGDFLEPFALPQLPEPDSNPAKAQRDNYAQILVGTDRRTMFSQDDFFMVDRGSDQGVTLGARFIIYRDKRRTEAAVPVNGAALPNTVIHPDFLFELGEAVVVDVKPGMATLRAMVSHDAFMAGDYAALRK